MQSEAAGQVDIDESFGKRDRQFAEEAIGCEQQGAGAVGESQQGAGITGKRDGRLAGSDGNDGGYVVFECGLCECEAAAELLIQEPDRAAECGGRRALGEEAAEIAEVGGIIQFQLYIGRSMRGGDQHKSGGRLDGDQPAGGVLQAGRAGKVSADGACGEHFEGVAGSGFKIVGEFDGKGTGECGGTAERESIELSGLSSPEAQREAAAFDEFHGAGGKSIGIATGSQFAGDTKSACGPATAAEDCVGGDSDRHVATQNGFQSQRSGGNFGGAGPLHRSGKHEDAATKLGEPTGSGRGGIDGQHPGLNNDCRGIQFQRCLQQIFASHLDDIGVGVIKSDAVSGDGVATGGEGQGEAGIRGEVIDEAAGRGAGER